VENGLPRYKLTLEYDGTGFVGWQKQSNGLAIQEVIETALAKINGAPVRIQGAGRTDAGVHALGQVAHADLARSWRTDSLRDALNAHMKPAPIAILETEAVVETFDARFSAIRRNYLYRIINRRSPLTLGVDRAWLVKRKLDAGAMNEAAQTLLGRHDFTTFRAAECQAASPMRTLEKLEITRNGEHTIEIRASARSFLHHQVRSMVGSLEHVGSGRWAQAELRAALDARDRSRCGVVAPASGLYLVSVDYDETTDKNAKSDDVRPSTRGLSQATVSSESATAGLFKTSAL
jgi:tRNA pseudouridine38-40 synthase